MMFEPIGIATFISSSCIFLQLSHGHNYHETLALEGTHIDYESMIYRTLSLFIDTDERE